MKSSQIIALFIAIAAIAWIGSGFFSHKGEGKAEENKIAAQTSSKEKELTQVRVRNSQAQEYISDIVITGRTQSSRSVILKAETEGQIKELLKEKGDKVAEGDILARLDARDRYSRVKETQERVNQREIEFNAAQKLQDKGFNSRVRLAQARADLENARAELKNAQVSLGNVKIAAPFEGIIYDQEVELGDFLSVGAALFTIVDLDPIEITGFLSERQVVDIKVGSAAQAELLDGERIEGTISYIAPAANPETRTFRVEITVPNENYRLKDGLTTQLFLPTPVKQAHKISPSILALDDAGKIGVKLVDESNKVQFFPVTILSDKPDHMWVGGLPEQTRLITVGQDFVAPGQIVKPVLAKGDGLL